MWPILNKTQKMGPHKIKSCKRWTEEEEELLVEEIRKYECLYNTTHPDYRNQTEKDLARIKIAKILNCSPVDVEFKFDALKDKFGRHRNQLAQQGRAIKNGAAPADVPVVKEWKLYESLLFLDSFMKFRPRSTSKKTQDEFSRANQELSSDDFEGAGSNSRIPREYNVLELLASMAPHYSTDTLCNVRTSGTHDPLDLTASPTSDDERERPNAHPVILHEQPPTLINSPEATHDPKPGPSNPSKKRKIFFGVSAALDETLGALAKSFLRESTVEDEELLAYGRSVALRLAKLQSKSRRIARKQIENVLNELEEQDEDNAYY